MPYPYSYNINDFANDQVLFEEEIQKIEKVKHPDNYAGRFSCLLLHKAKLEKYPFMSLKNLLLQSGRIDPESNESFKTDNKIFTGSSCKDK